ncbi:hypothetical protein EGT07_24160 [Herbaspirillum sp. HC18]|nr:hypothetical protein EGT07_24160 [Herbaspirillum sp. HC18]
MMLSDHVTEQAQAALSESCGVNAEWMNKECACISLEASALRRALETELGDTGLYELVAERCPHVFAALPVFVSGDQIRKMADVVTAVESVVALPAYREKVLAGASPIARHNPGGAKGVFFGYDFHVGPEGVGLIEINTNAGGAMFNAALARAQRACCPAVESLLPRLESGMDMDHRIMDMFRREWAASRGTAPWRTVAIVDAAPASQYLYPEFLMFQRLFERYGVRAVIADPSELVFKDNALWHDNTVVDLVYNRLTDFMLDESASAALRAAYLSNAIVLTPHPRAHALYADKRNLVQLSDPEQLQELGVPHDIQQILLETIPRTVRVTKADAQRLWSERRQLFFKPAAGFGGRAAYRGDKLTKRVWEDILTGDYVAQSVVLPGERAITSDTPLLKYDVRNYAYDGAVQSLAARLYQGQTTNFRTPGGGFAPVYRWPE